VLLKNLNFECFNIMSQKKTVVPGVNQDGDDFTPQAQQPFGAGNYSRTSNDKGNRTFYPGMEETFNAMPQEQTPKRTQASDNHKPIVGFLYSVSRTSVGEFWPLYIGQNLIGSSSECDIVLHEATVSQRHAILHINKMKKPEKIEATISDCQSTNGTMVNGNSVSVARPPECVNGDIITIGENYELVFILIDVKAYGLTQSESFMAVGQNDNKNSFRNTVPSNHGTVDRQDFPPHFTNPDIYGQQSGAYSRTEGISGTVGTDETSQRGFRPGGTKGMTSTQY
jgi:pSer/pThr/pTyr-binding forkhead associated (FHA) protein